MSSFQNHQNPNAISEPISHAKVELAYHWSKFVIKKWTAPMGMTNPKTLATKTNVPSTTEDAPNCARILPVPIFAIVARVSDWWITRLATVCIDKSH